MAYLYKTIIYKNTTNVLGLNVTQNNNDKTDFELNMVSALKINELVIAETSYIIDVSYTDFKAKIDGTVVKWIDVKYIEDVNKYILYIVSDVPL